MSMESLAAYIPADRRQALARGLNLPSHALGAALFADISGFTPLTETLFNTLGPQRGAEELSRQLNVVYDELIVEVDRYRGSVLAFSGDAITCWFEGDSSTPSAGQASKRAVTCGLAMQTAMRQFATLTTSTGATVSLAMKVAVVAGPARRFVVGDPNIQRIDVLAGTTLDRMATVEKHAQRGEVVVDADTLAQLGDEAHVVRDASDDSGHFVAIGSLKRRARQSPWPALATNALPSDTLRVWLLPPVYARLREGQAQFLAEIRPSVALFLSFSGIDYDSDPGAGDKLDAYIRHVQQSLNHYEAFVLMLTFGDKGCYLYAAFGAPLAHDDDPRRAVAAALELLALSRNFDYIRKVQIGLNQGRVWCGAYGGATRRTYGVLGDAVNMAARLMSRATPNTILVSASVAQVVAPYYDLEPIGALTLKGKTAPLSAFRVLQKQSAHPTALRDVISHPLVGREPELRQLNALWQSACGGKGQVVRLTGAPGVGKSHLIQELGVEVVNQGGRMGLGVCHSTEQAVAYAPWHSILLRLLTVPNDRPNLVQQTNAVLTAIRALHPEWDKRAPLLGDVLNLPIPDNPATAALEPKLRREAVWALVVDVVRALARQQPLLIWLDDVHWIDEASRALTLAVSRALENSSILILCTQRPLLQGEADPFAEWEQLSNYQALSLAELGGNDMAALVQNHLRGHVRPLALALIQKQAQGNAFYAQELVDAMREADHLVQRADAEWHLSERLFALLQDQHCLTRDRQQGWWTLTYDATFSAETLGLPDSIQRAITARIDPLSPDVQLTLKTASVIGPRFEAEILVLAHPRFPGREALEAQMTELGKRGLIRQTETNEQPAYVFEHNLIQEGVYNNLLAAQRVELHASVGVALEEVRREAVGQLAYHFSRADQRDKALIYLGQAADKAKREYANETALKYYEQALALESRWEWHKAQIEVLHILGRRAEEQAALESLGAMRGVPAFEVAYLWGQYYESISDYVHAQESLERARTIAHERFNRVNEAISLTRLGLVAYRRGQYEQAREWFEQVRMVFPQKTSYPAEEARPLAQANNGVGLALRQLGNLAEAVPYFQQALALYRQCGDQRGEAQSLGNLGLINHNQRNFSEAVAFHQQALELRRAIGDRAGQGDSLNDLATVTRDTGDYLRAREYLHAALHIQQETDNQWGQANIWSDLGILHQELGKFSEAQRCLQHGLELSQTIGDEAGQAFALANLGLTAIDQGEWITAKSLLNQGLALARSQHDHQLEANFNSYLGEVFRQTAEYETAGQWALAALTIRRTSGANIHAIDNLATLALVRLGLNDISNAQEYTRHALDALKACKGEGPEFPQYDYWACYRVLEASGQTEEARAALQAAYELVMARAVRITDLELRLSFLENAPRNRQVMEDARRVLKI